MRRERTQRRETPHTSVASRSTRVVRRHTITGLWRTQRVLGRGAGGTWVSPLRREVVLRALMLIMQLYPTDRLVLRFLCDHQMRRRLVITSSPRSPLLPCEEPPLVVKTSPKTERRLRHGRASERKGGDMAPECCLIRARTLVSSTESMVSMRDSPRRRSSCGMSTSNLHSGGCDAAPQCRGVALAHSMSAVPHSHRTHTTAVETHRMSRSCQIDSGPSGSELPVRNPCTQSVHGGQPCSVAGARHANVMLPRPTYAQPGGDRTHRLPMRT